MGYDILYLVIGAIVVALASNLITMYTVDIHKMRAIKAKMEKIQRKVKERKKEMDTEEMKKLLDEQYRLMMEQMKYSLKSSLFGAIFIIPALYLLKRWVGNSTFLLPFPLPFLGDKAGWITLYIFYVILFSILIKKVLNLTY